MDLAILIPTKNRHQSLRRSLGSIVPAAARVEAAIVICDQSRLPFADTGPWRVLHRPDLSGLPAARNLLLRATAADLVCFCDDDVDMSGDFCCRLLAIARAAEPDEVAWGPVVETRPRALRRMHRLCPLGAQRDQRRLLARRCDRSTPLLFGCCFAVRRQAALTCGFDQRLTGYGLGEDVDFCRRVPGRKRFCRELRLNHREDDAGRSEPRQRGIAKARHALRCARRHGTRNPVSVLHLALYLLAAAGGRGREPASLGGLLAGLRRPT